MQNAQNEHYLDDLKIRELIAQTNTSGHEIWCTIKIITCLVLTGFGRADSAFIAYLIGVPAFIGFLLSILDLAIGKKIKYKKGMKAATRLWLQSKILVCEFSGFDGPLNVGNTGHNLIITKQSGEQESIRLSVASCELFAKRCKRGDYIYALEYPTSNGQYKKYIPFLPALLDNKSSIPTPNETDIESYYEFKNKRNQQLAFMAEADHKLAKKRDTWSAEDENYNW